MPGTQLLTYLQLGKESTAGTAVAAARMLYPDGTGLWNLDRMRTRHDSANRGTRTNRTHVTQQGVALRIPFRTAQDVGVSFDELIYPFSQIKGGVTGSGGAADKTWTFTPSQTGSNAQESYTIEFGDDVQEYEAEYCQASDFTLSAGVDDLTQLEMNFFGRQSTKSTKTSVTANNGVKIPGYLWKIRFATAQSGLSGASDQTNFLVGWSLNVQTGLVPRKYQDGNAYFGQSVEAAPLIGTLDLVVESTSTAVSQFYDKAASDTIDFIQLKATGPSLGSSNYSAQIQLCVSYDDPEVIGAESDGVNLYNVKAHLMLDSTWNNSIVATVVNSLAAIP